MKKVFLLMLVLILAFVLTGCKDVKDEDLTKENNFGTTIEEARIIENMIYENIEVETIEIETIEIETIEIN